MSAPFHFPTEYAKIGNWPGSLGPNQAQALLMEALTHKKGAVFVELGFDGGRTTIVLNWAAREIEELKIVTAPVLNDETGLWYRRAQILFNMDRARVGGVETLEPFAADMVVFNPAVSAILPMVHEWIRAAAPGASIVRIGGEADSFAAGLQEVVKAPGITIWHKPERTVNVVERVVKSVADEFVGKAVAILDKDRSAKLRSLPSRKERHRDGDSADTKVHEAVATNEGVELLPS